MPVYNGSRFIDTTIRCLVNQTFADFELIIFDDASTDESWEILSQWAEREPRIRLFRHEVNKGVFETQKDLAAVARGELIAQQDQDDYSAPERLATQVEILQRHPDAVGTVSNVWLVDEHGEPIGTSDIPTTPEELDRAMRRANVCYHSSLMMRRAVFEEIGGYSVEADHVADYDLLLNLLKRGALVPAPQALVTYGLNPGTVTYRDRATQAALAQNIRHKHFGAPKPEQIVFQPLGPEDARAFYNKEVGLLHLSKGNQRKARHHLREVLRHRPSGKDYIYYAAAWLPAGCVRLLKRLKGNKAPAAGNETYFLHRT